MVKTALYDRHLELGGKIVDFHGFEMPLQYPDGIINEHNHVRTQAGVFDVSHMGDIFIQDESQGEEIQRLFTNKIMGINTGKSVYTHMTDDDGIIIDDLIVTRLSESQYLLVPNASMIDEVGKWITQNSSLSVVNRSDEISCLAVQGPKSKEVLANLLGDEIEEIKRFTIKGYDFSNGRFLNECDFSNDKDKGVISRTGYTGEEGFEIILYNEYVKKIWDGLLKYDPIKVLPIGLGARDTLRLEMGYLLSGQDFHRDRTPLETNCSWVIKWDHDFIGKEALQIQKESDDYQKLTGFRVDGKVPARSGSAVRLPASPHETVGSVSSGNHSPSLGVPIGLAYIEKEYSEPGNRIEIEYRNRTLEAVTAKTPLYTKQQE